MKTLVQYNAQGFFLVSCKVHFDTFTDIYIHGLVVKTVVKL